MAACARQLVNMLDHAQHTRNQCIPSVLEEGAE
jgi:hypothetical protein